MVILSKMVTETNTFENLKHGMSMKSFKNSVNCYISLEK